MKKKRDFLIIIVEGILLVYLLFQYVWDIAPQVSQTLGKTVKQDDFLVVIDAGHGGIDPGKVGMHGELEKDINLQIAMKCRSYLEQQHILVKMTREEDQGLYRENDTNKKIIDMKNRVTFIEENKPDLVVSIHQNSYVTEGVSGPQVFFYRDSLESKKAAENMQMILNDVLQPEKNRVEKENCTYYLLKKTSVPIIIVECGFLSNDKESRLLTLEEYQERVAWAVFLGIRQYLQQKK